VDHIVDRNVFVEQATMGIVIAVLPVEEEATASLRIKIPEQHAHASFCKKASQVYGCCGFSNASLDVIYGDLFQKILAGFSESKLTTKQ
jgi:hypothetical protein